MKKMYNTLRLLLILLAGTQFSAIAQTTTYTSSGAYTYTVPAGVTGLTVTVKGAQGGQNSDELDYPDRAGYGGCVTAFISVTPGQVLDVNVGGCGSAGTSTAGGAGGFNGGGNGSYGTSVYSGGGGGGASDIRLSTGALTDRLVVAGGGGGAGINCGNERGGDGGSPTVGGGGETGQAICGTETGGEGGLYNSFPAIGGTCTGCGASSPGTAGDISIGGNGGTLSAGGGGGGGMGAGGGGEWTGGGGGSDYYGGTGVTLISESRGCNSSCGSVLISVSCVAGNITGSNQVCQGTSNPALTDVGGVGVGTWSSSNPAIGSIGTTGVVYGVGSGTITITYTLSAYCHTTFPMTVNPTPSAISGVPVLCVNQTTTLLEGTPLGSWSSDNSSIAMVGSGSGVVTGESAGTCNIIYTVNATGCSTSIPFVVNPIPAAVVGPDTVCEGSSATITDVTPGGTWSNVGTHASIVGSGTTGTVNGLTNGVDVISYTFPATGCAAAFPFTVNPLPSGIGGPAFVCMGTTGTETDISGGGSWSIISGSGTASIGSGSGTITPISVGTVTVVYTLPTSCSVTRTVSIDASPSPITTLTSGQVCIGSSILLSDATGLGAWSASTPTVGTVVGGTVTGVGIAGVGGTDTISYTVGTCAAKYVVTVNPKPTAITGPTQVCVGDCGEVYGSGPGAGIWSSSSLATGTIDPVSGTFCALAPGTTTIMYTFTATGCARSIIVTVNANPTISPVAPQVCETYSITLTGAPGSGTWATSSSNISLIAGTGVVTGVTAGTALVTYTAPITTCTVTALVTVNPLPNPIVSSLDPMCMNSTATLTSPGTPGGTWSTVSTIESIGSATGIITGIGVIGGVATNVYTLPTGCFVTYDETLVSLPTFGPAPPATMCAGTTANITGNGGAGAWTSSAGGIASVANGAGGTGVITAITSGVTNMCFTFTTAPACQLCQTMNVIPALTPITGPTTVCTGSSITLTSGPAGGGTWGSSTGAATVVAGAGATGIVTGVTTVGSPTTITYTLGTCSASYVVSVNQTPNPITVSGTNSFNICQGLTTTMCTTGPGPGGYSWSSSNPLVATLTSAGLCATATGISAGTSIIKYTNGFTGCFSQQTLTVTNGVAAISGPNAVCMGSTVTETDASPAGYWSSSNGGVATVTFTSPGPTSNSTTVSPVAPGTFTLTFLSGSGCTATKVMTVNPIPSNTVIALSSTNLCPGGSVELTASTGTGYTYQWLDPGVIAGATGATYSATAAGTYAVTVTDPAGPCSITSAGTGVTMNPINPVITYTGTATTCASSPVTLNASPATTYQWQLGGVAVAGATAATFTPTISGTYTVSESNAFGCTGVSTGESISYVASPAGVVTLSGPLNICSGSGVTLTADAGVGYTYQWYNGGLGSPITGATNMSYTATTAGNYFVIDVNPTGCSTTSATSIVLVSPLPVASISTGGASKVFCSGGSISLTAPASAGNTFQWYNNGLAVAGATNATYVAGTSGHYTVKIDSPASGCIGTSAADTIVVVTTPGIELLTPSSFCWGSSSDLAAIIVSGAASSVTYQWMKSSVNLPGATNSTYNATVSGNYSVEVFVAGGICNETSPLVSITERPLPNPLVSDSTPNMVTQRYYISYVWYLDGVVIPGAASFYTPIIGNGTYKVKVTDTNGCQSVSAGFPVSNWVPNSIGNINGNIGNIKIYPNPAQDALHIDAPMVVRAVVISLDGRSVIDQQAATLIDISRLPAGIYTIKLFDTNGNMVKVDKLVKDGN